MSALLKHPSAWLPIAMSFTAGAILVGFVLIHGVARQEDEGTAAHLFQIFIGGQIPLILFFFLKWFPRSPNEAAKVLALQIMAALVVCAPVLYFQW